MVLILTSQIYCCIGVEHLIIWFKSNLLKQLIYYRSERVVSYILAPKPTITYLPFYLLQFLQILRNYVIFMKRIRSRTSKEASILARAGMGFLCPLFIMLSFFTCIFFRHFSVPYKLFLRKVSMDILYVDHSFSLELYLHWNYIFTGSSQSKKAKKMFTF